MPRPKINKCAAPGCGKPLPPSTGTRPKLYCDSTCRSRASRGRGDGADHLTVVTVAAATGSRRSTSDPDDDPRPSLVQVVQRELENGERLDTVAGQQALAIAVRMASAGTTGSAVATLSKELRVAMAEALAGVKRTKPDAFDEIAERRAMKAANA